MKKKKSKKTKQELMFPKQLAREDLFKCPIWFGDEPGFVNELNKASERLEKIGYYKNWNREDYQNILNRRSR